MASLNEEDELAMSTDELLQAQVELYHHCFAFVKSLALKAATDLRIPDAIHRRGGAATLSDLAAETGIHPTKLSNLRRLMRVLTTSGVFSVVDDSAGVVYRLTRVSHLLVGAGGRPNLSPVVGAFVSRSFVAALFSMHEGFTNERAAAMSLYEVAHGSTIWETTVTGRGSEIFNAAMAADSRFTMDNLLREECGGSIFGAVKGSLVDVGGGHGAAASAIASAFPHVKCTVLDLPHVVAGAPAHDNVTFVAGDMFDYIPPADVVLLKWILHDWNDQDCVKILRRCKEAIPTRDEGGKVIVIDMVVVGSGESQGIVSTETEVLLDGFMMCMDGIEREEHEWRKIFVESGFTDYKIGTTMGIRRLIELYP
ncbi:acetylserotonin O-methyltransferase 3-like [Lolium rigidum]|uniref:acetylserotonin O-methyltransferase 3-like n=1 Tax=Lolium rigidum TaxID=89674 RepID=UPI001F5C4986|nr:acetylserotonin O-methyltransferase 3-like [Lolium rigidum]